MIGCRATPSAAAISSREAFSWDHWHNETIGKIASQTNSARSRYSRVVLFNLYIRILKSNPTFSTEGLASVVDHASASISAFEEVIALTFFQFKKS